MIVGGDDVSYGDRPPDAPNWREKMLREVKLDPTARTFSGALPYAQYVKVLQVSAAHVYLTYPFVLSWSLLEAMACGAPMSASDTAPVREVKTDGVNGRLVDFFNVDQIARLTIDACRSSCEPVIVSAVATASRFSVGAGVAGYKQTLLKKTARQESNQAEYTTIYLS